ncbi:MAG: inorganic phosphate transporter [Clostridiales bacterium]|nr:inorganic phosphate transporter [Clostridiales bacterium]
MTVTLSEFFANLTSNPMMAVTVLLTLGVIMMNGCTDAPNAIATCVSTRAMRPKTAIAMAAVFNFLGIMIMTMINANVASTIYNMVDFGTDTTAGTTAICAALFAIIVWSFTSWRLGLPVSESHALVAGISGAAIAIHGGIGGINGSEWVKVIYGLVLSTALGFLSGYVTAKIIEKICKHMDRLKTTRFFRSAQIVGGAAMAFMHGAQDGQKFMGVFMLGVFISTGRAGVTEFAVPIWLMALCSAVMAFGTSIGGYRIIKSVGLDMVKLESYQGFAADISACISLLVASITGIPVSTTHTKTTAIMGVGASRRLSAVNWGVVKNMVKTWILVFPGCGLMGFVMVKIFMAIFG